MHTNCIQTFLIIMLCNCIFSEAPLPQEELTQEVLPVDVALVLAADDSPIDGPVRIGTLCKLKMTLRGGDG